MGHHQSPSNSTEHDDHDLVADRLAAELGLEDIIKFSASRRAAAETQFDDEIALYRQLEMFDDAIKTIDDHDTAEILSHAIDRGLLRIESLSAQTAQDDRRAALALSDTGELPPRSEVQKLMDHPILQAFIQSPFKEGRHGSIAEDTLAKSVEGQHQDSSMSREGSEEVVLGVRPRCSLQTLADWSETAHPLPSPPEAELKNPVVLETVIENPDLFEIVTPIRVDIFEELLINHPNPAFVASVCKGLREGFWPFADTYIGKYPGTYDGSLTMPSDPAKVKFLRDQRDIEIAEGRFSRSFGKDLLPGMYSSPTHVEPKRGTSDFRLVTDLSSGRYSLNSMINHEDIDVPHDDMRHLREKLLRATAHAKGRKLTLWRSDIAEAYRRCPMHPHWQIKQVITIDGERYIDRNNVSEGPASFKIWGSVNSLVMWIAEHVCKIDRPFCYNDYAFGVCDADDIEFYEPYERQMPREQCRLLELWNILGIPHEEEKQLSGPSLTIIGIEVDANRMSMTLPADGKAALIKELHRFIDQPDEKARSFSLEEFQRLTDRMTAAFNVFPLLRPALANIDDRVREVDRDTASGPNTQILCDPAIRDDLIWALKHIQNPKHPDGVRISDARAWEPEEADMTLYSSSNHQFGAFWYPGLTPSIGYYFDVPRTASNRELFLSALCVASAFRDAAYRGNSSSKIVIYTDNLSTVKMFDSFQCVPKCNRFLKAVADVMIKHNHKLKVLHTSAKQNIVANLISQGLRHEACKLAPGLIISQQAVWRSK